MHQLKALGFGPFFERQLQPSDGPVARIAAEHRDRYDAWSACGEHSARLSGRLRAQLADERLPCVGDWVILRSEEAAVIERVLERRTVFTRVGAGREHRVQAVAANVDWVFAVCGLDADFSVHRIERYVARIWASGAGPAVVLNKADIDENAGARAGEVTRRCPGVPVFVTSALLDEGVATVRACIRPGETAAFVGSSGTGKSSLINALLGEERLPTADVRSSDGRGCHTTTHRQLVLLPGGGLVLDTPGMRELQLVDSEGLDAVFEDIAALAGRCRFRDCSHDLEPGCAVREAVEAGRITSERVEHYRKLEDEAEASERRRDVRLRRQDERQFSRRAREAVRLRQRKEEL